MTGRHPHEPTADTRRQVRELAAFGLTNKQIGSVMNISGPTVSKHYEDELEQGKSVAIAQVARTLFKEATKNEKPNITAAIFYLKSQAGWNDRADSLGKKEQMDLDAIQTASGKFATTPPPLKAVK